MASPKQVGSFTIKNHAALSMFAKRFAPAITQPEEAPKLPSSADIFKHVNMSNNVELSDSSQFTIDVQPDFRYIFAYICFHVESHFAEYNVKGHPSVSPPSLIGYCLALVYAHILACDSSARSITSNYAVVFKNDAHLKDFLSSLLTSYVPEFMEPILLQLAPTYDPRRSLVEFIPSLAGFSFKYDFGRILPINIFIRAHHLVASTRSNRDPDDVLVDLYSTPLININDPTPTNPNRVHTMRIGNVFGTCYTHGNQAFTHTNWLNSKFEKVYNPVVGRALTQRPTFTRMPTTPQSAQSYDEINPYIYALNCDDDNIATTSSLDLACSRFISSANIGSKQLGQISQLTQGITVLNYAIHSPTLPTWVDKDCEIEEYPDRAATHQQFATHTEFLVSPAPGDVQIDVPEFPEDFPGQLVLMRDVNYVEEQDPITFVTFDPTQHVNPFVNYFQPYDVSPSSLSYTIFLGILTETGSVDGFTVPHENPTQALIDSNSQIKQSAIRFDKLQHVGVFSPYPTTVRARSILTHDSQSVGVAFADMSMNMLPNFARTNLPAALPNALYGFTAVSNHVRPEHAYTYAAFKHDNPRSLPNNSIYGWSSYRLVEKVKTPRPTDKYMLLSLRPIYGTNVTLSRSRHPTLIIPQ